MAWEEHHAGSVVQYWEVVLKAAYRAAAAALSSPARKGKRCC